ncbi:MAG TPA: IPT/TIG domain-containing protein [Bryobacteraceae bacterium]|nr:IPT/TIG domain-containing protein [Bryobacteraceae bacterium]
MQSKIGLSLILLIGHAGVAVAQYTQQGPKLVGEPQVAGARQGYAVAISGEGNTAIIGAPRDNASPSLTPGLVGGAFVFVRAAGRWVQDGEELVGYPTVGDSKQGYSVALSSDGTTALVGGPYDNNYTGAAWVWVRTGQHWTLQAKLVATDNVQAASGQGLAVSLSADGNTAAIGAPGESAVWIWTRSGTQWSEQAKVVGTGGYGHQGRTVALSGDGVTLVEGGVDYSLDYSTKIAKAHSLGGTWLLARTGDQWTQQGFVSLDITSTSFYPQAAAISADGNTALISSLGTWIWKRSAGQWTQQTQLVNSGAVIFPQSIALSADGATACTVIGTIQVFSQKGDQWTQQESSLTGTEGVGFYSQPLTVSVSADGSTLISGNPADNNDLGSAWVFANRTTASNAPAIADVSPGSVPAGAPFTLTVDGSNFVAGAVVQFGGTALTTTFVNANRLQATVPPAATAIPGFSAAVVVNPDGQQSNTFPFAVMGSLNVQCATFPLVFQTVIGETVTGPQGCKVGTSPPGGEVRVVGASTWLSTSLASGILTVAANPAGMRPGDYNGEIDVSGAGQTSAIGVALYLAPATASYIQQGPKLTFPQLSGAMQGYAVAISGDGNTAILGTKSSQPGTFLVFTRSGGVWSPETARLPLSGSPDVQGASVALSYDGNIALVGVPSDVGGVGAVSVFVRSGGQWMLQAKLSADDHAGASGQGSSVSLSADGNTAAVGGNLDNNGAGAVWVWTRSGAQWTEQAKMIATGDANASAQGSAVAVAADGSTLIESGVDFTPYPYEYGAAWVFALSEGQWKQQGPNLYYAPVLGLSAPAVAISGDGNTAIMGTDGGVILLVRSSGQWLYSNPAGPSGPAVSISADGSIAVVGNPANQSNGSVWTFARSEDRWILMPNELDGAGAIGSPQFGSSVAVSADGSTILVGGPGDDNGTGAAWVFAAGVTSNPAPLVASISPTSAAVGTAGFTLTVNGSNFVSGSTVQFGGVALFTTYVGPTRLIATVTISSIQSPGAIPVSVINPDQKTSGFIGFMVSATVTATCSNLHFSATVGGPLTAPRTCAVGTLPAGGAVTISEIQGSWLSAAIDNGALTVHANPSVLPASTYNGSITLAADSAASTTIKVSLSILSASVLFVQQGQKLVGNPFAAGAQQGFSAALSGDGNTAVLGAPGDNAMVGGAFVFTRAAGQWSQFGGELVGSAPAGSSQQGWSVAISNDGSTALVGGPTDRGGVGTVWVWIQSAGRWSEQAKLQASDAVGNAGQGCAVALSADGNTAAIGGCHDSNEAGAVWIWKRSGGQWSEQIKLVGTDAPGGAKQGSSVTLSADGATMMEGGLAQVLLGQDFGTNAWAFAFLNGKWTQQDGLIIPGIYGQVVNVGLSADGNTAVANASQGSDIVAEILTRSGGHWGGEVAVSPIDDRVTYVFPPYDSNDSAFGTTVAISGDGAAVVIGVANDNLGNGATWLFTKSGGNWRQQGGRVFGTGASGAAGQGASVAVSNDGRTILWGGNADNGFTGAAWVSGVSYPVPVVTSLSPPSAVAGDVGFTLTVNGAQFVPGSVVTWNNSPLTTMYRGSNQLTAAVPAGVIASVGSASIAVVNPDQGTSATATFTITQPVFNVQCAPPSLSFAYTSGGAAPTPQSCSITSTPSGVGVTATPTPGGSWLASSLSSAVTPANLTVAVNTGGLTAGSYSGSIALSSPIAADAKIPVTLAVVASGSVFAISPSSSTVPAAGGSGSVSVIASLNGAAWQASSNAAWITITSNSSGAGTGTLSYRADANTSTSQRTGTITIARLTFMLVQPGTAGLALHLVTPCRVVDTRAPAGPLGGPLMRGGETRDFPILSGACGIPASAKAYSLNLTAVSTLPAVSLNYLTIWPGGESQPAVSTLNGAGTSNAAIVAAGANGSISVFASDETDLTIDVIGYFSPPDATGLAYFPLTPCRVAEPVLAANETRAVSISGNCGIPSNAQAYAMNVTSQLGSYLQSVTVWPAGPSQPDVPTLNQTLNVVPTSNFTIMPAGPAGAIDISVSGNTSLQLDVTGYFAPSGAGSLFFAPGALFFYPVAPCRVADTRGPVGPFGGPALVDGVKRDFPIPLSACGLPASAQAYSFNFASVYGETNLTVWPQGMPQPQMFTITSERPAANASIIAAGLNGGISVVAVSAMHLIIDTNGYFAP